MDKLVEIFCDVDDFVQFSFLSGKNYYIGFIHRFYKEHFPNLLSYTRFLEVMPKALVPLCSYFSSVKGIPSGIELY
jgi:hypothetical protein